MASGEAPGERLSARSTKGHVEPMSPREAVGICGRAPEEDGPGHCGEHTGAGWGGRRRPCRADPGAVGGDWGPGALEVGGTHGRAEVAAAGAALVLHHPAPVVLTQHQQRRLAGRTHQLMLHHTVRAPAQLPSGETRSAHHTQHGVGGWGARRKAKGAGGPDLHVHPAHQEKQVR